MLQHSQRLVERKNAIGHVRRWPGQVYTPRNRSSSQDYPVFTPSYQEFASFPLESSDESTNALRHERLLSPFTLDHTDIQRPRVGANYGRPPDDKSTSSKASVYEAFIQGRKIESKPHCIMAIHPNRGQVYNSQSMHGQISSQVAIDWEEVPQLIYKKPLGEFFNDVSTKSIKPTHHASSDIQVTQRPATSDTSTLNKTVPIKKDNCDPSGCLACDKCLPGGRVTVFPLMDSRDYTEIPSQDRNLADIGEAKKTSNHSLMSWFRPKKKVSDMREKIFSKIQASPKSTDQDRTMQNTVSVVDKCGVDSNIKDMERTVNLLKLEVSQVTQRRDAALVEVLELKLALKEMEKKVDHLEEYCQSFNKLASEKPLSESISVGELCDLKGDRSPIAISSPWSVHNEGPTKKEFCNAVTEARIGVKQFCRTLLQQIQEQSAVEKIESILQPYNVKVAPRVSKSVRYHIESLINQVFFEDFENIKFQRSGTTCILDPMQRPQAFYKAYLAVSQMGWSELVTMGSVAYCESFDGFCDFKMNRMEDLLNWDGRWPDELARAFFVAARWVWLLHMLAFSFEHPAMILRVGPEEHFDPCYMEELLAEQNSKLKQGSGIDVEASACVKAMVMPGFLFTCREVIKCKVILSRLPVTPNSLS